MEGDKGAEDMTFHYFRERLPTNRLSFLAAEEVITIKHCNASNEKDEIGDVMSKASHRRPELKKNNELGHLSNYK